MKKNIKIILGLILTVAFVMWLLSAWNRQLNSVISIEHKEISDKIDEQNDLGSKGYILSKWLSGSPATTSAIGMSVGAATSSLSIDTSGADSIDLNILAFASSSAASLNYNVEFSNSVNCPAGANVDWFPEDGSSVDSVREVTHGNGPLVHIVSLATSTNNTASNYFRKNIAITPLASRCMRINLGVTGASTTLWAELAVREPLN